MTRPDRHARDDRRGESTRGAASARRAPFRLGGAANAGRVADGDAGDVALAPERARADTGSAPAGRSAGAPATAPPPATSPAIAPAAVPAAAPAFVEIENVSLRYAAAGTPEGTLAVEGLSLDVPEGAFVAVVGPSGCGKSTLMKLATGLHFPSEGRVRVAGRAVDGPVSIAGMAFQNPVMLPWRLTRDNVLLPLEVVEPHRRRFRSKRPAYRERADELLASVGLAGAGDSYPWQLSGGMQQRASLCRALIHEPELLMLDEPFGALDAFTREELWCVIRDLHAERRFTTVLVTHDLREAVFLADVIYVMSARPGRIVVERPVPLERPRPIDVTYEREFVDIVQELRAHIAEARG